MIVAFAATIARTPPQPADDAPHLLLVDDDRRIRDLLSRFLSGEGYRVTTAMSASDARAKLLGLHFDLLILDVMMPGETGFDLARFIRTSSSVPIIMLTARHEAEARIEGLQIGADDYVAKPFSPRELAARIKAILRRVEQRGEDAMLSARDIVLRRDSRDVTVAGAQIELTSKEFDLLACFLEHPGIVLSREKLLDIVWGMTYPGGTRTVDVHVAQLRRKLGDPETIRTVRGAGYKLQNV